MNPSLRLVPADGGPSKASVKDTSNELGLHDTLRNGPRSLAHEVKGGSVLQQRLEKWEETQDNLKLTLQRNLYGLHMPTQSNIHLDVLMGRDEMLDTADIFGDRDTSVPLDIHSEMERKRGI
ncbi:hypothetical protein K439DRAFT_634879 [Ramaria rubella]|nr:hypothetical protein K439DRAFT_634879 [Ramaria rubella]